MGKLARFFERLNYENGFVAFEYAYYEISILSPKEFESYLTRFFDKAQGEQDGKGTQHPVVCERYEAGWSFYEGRPVGEFPVLFAPNLTIKGTDYKITLIKRVNGMWRFIFVNAKERKEAQLA
ncbi:MAG: hypothetical protein HY514_02000 [Candidatus Aenigmarchaeota archaeon]|nr:hypothetical protein [Candidatus Aenigmarchaeota archaeon]